MRQFHFVILILLFTNIFSQPVIHQDPYLKFDNLTKKDGLSNNFILDIYQDRFGFMWIGTMDGLNRYNAYDFEIFRNDPDDSLSISGNLVTAITADKYGNIWIGTKNGLNKYSYENIGFQRFMHDDNNENTLSDDYVRALYADKKGILWIETADGTLHNYDIENNRFIKYKHRKPMMVNTYFYHRIFEDENGFLWLGGRNMGIFKFDPTNESFTEILPDPNDQSKKRDRDVADYFIDSTGTYWISGLDGLYRFEEDREVFSKKLPVSTYSIVEDDYEKLWLGTGSGVYVYSEDRNIFTSHIHNENNQNSLISNHVNKILIDHSGNIWIGTTDGISIYSPTKNKFKHVYHISGDDNSLTSNNIIALHQDKNENIWIGTESEGIDRFDKSFNLIDHYGQEEPSGHKIISDRISSIMEDSDGDIWVGLWSGRGFNIIDPVENKVGSYSMLKNSLRADWYNDIMQDRDGNFWVGIWGAVGLVQFDKDMEVFKDETFTLLNINLNSRVSKITLDNELVWFYQSAKFFSAFNTKTGKYNMYFIKNNLWIENLIVNQIFLDIENKLWIATNQGLFNKVYDPYISFKQIALNRDKIVPDLKDEILAIANSTDKNLLWLVTANGIELFNKRDNKSSFINKLPFSDTKINFIFEDNNQLWIGTQTGLYSKLRNKKTFTKSEKLLRADAGKEEINAICYLKEENGNFWLGTSLGLHYYDADRKIFKKSDLLPDHEIFSLTFDNSGSLWIGTNNGLYKSKDNRIIKSFTASDSDKNTLAGNSVLSLAFDERGNLWIGTDKGLCLFEEKTGAIIRQNKQQEKYLSSRLTRSIYEDKQGNIWVGTTDKGVNKIETKTGKIIHYKDNLQDSTAFWGKGAACVVQDVAGNIWIGGFGLNKYEPETESFVHYTESDGLANNNVMGILEDNSGKLWISTQDGLSRFDPTTITFENFFSKDGLQDNEFTIAHHKLKNNYLMFGGKNGLNIFDPENINKNEVAPNISISNFKIFDKKTNYKFPQTKKIELEYDQNYFSFDFAAHDFSIPLKNRYAYKLENFDPGWFNTVASNRTAKYTNVPHGDYIFRVKAANNDGVWNETGTSVELTIDPPFWKTLWFYSLEGLLFVILIVVYIKYREKNIKEKNKLLLLEQKLLRSQMNPHFIFNSLTSIQSFIFENNPIEAGSYLSKFSELIRSILYNSREEYISLEREIKTLENYIEMQQLRYDNKFDFEIDIDPKIDVEMIAVPPMLAQPFIENSIEHGIKHIDRRGFISIKYSLSDDSIILIIEDNGIGVEASKKLKDNKAQEHKSLAIIITKERMGILNRKRKKKSYSMHMDEIVSENNIVKGTRTKFIIPYLKI